MISMISNTRLAVWDRVFKWLLENVIEGIFDKPKEFIYSVSDFIGTRLGGLLILIFGVLIICFEAKVALKVLFHV